MNAVNINDLISRLTPVFAKHRDKVRFAYLFGSLSKEDATPLSDIDIAVFLFDTDISSLHDIRFLLYNDICRAVKRNDIDIIILNTLQNIILLDEIVKYGHVIFETDTEIREDFEISVLHHAIDFKNQRYSLIGI